VAVEVMDFQVIPTGYFVIFDIKKCDSYWLGCRGS